MSAKSAVVATSAQPSPPQSRTASKRTPRSTTSSATATIATTGVQSAIAALTGARSIGIPGCAASHATTSTAPPATPRSAAPRRGRPARQPAPPQGQGARGRTLLRPASRPPDSPHRSRRGRRRHDGDPRDEDERDGAAAATGSPLNAPGTTSPRRRRTTSPVRALPGPEPPRGVAVARPRPR